MIHCDVNDLYKNRYVSLWALMSFKAGILNTVGFLFVGAFVSHVTGFGSLIGVSIVHKEYDFGAELLVIPLFFILGGVLTSLILDINYDEKKIPRYPIVQTIITILLGIVNMLFVMDIYDDNTLPMKHNEDAIILIALLCFICGLKNSLTTWATHGRIRTTHLTGLSTDIGIHFPKILLGNGFRSRYPESRKITVVRLITLFSFALGAFITAILVPLIGYKVLTGAFVISIFLLIICIVNYNLHTKALKEAL